MPSAPRTIPITLLAALLLLLAPVIWAGDAPAIFPLDQVQPGMKGEVYTIFQGDTIEKVDLEVIGVMHNALGPKQDIIIVRLLGDEVAKTGVVAGMSGSPVYIDGKLAGALSLKLGSFTREAIGGVTPIENMYDAEKSSPPPRTDGTKSANISAGSSTQAGSALAAHIPFPETFAQQASAGAGQFLVPIETPLIASGIYPGTIAEFSKQLSAWGMSMVAGGTAAASPEDAKLQPGDMVGIELIRGDLSLAPGCTVTTVQDGRILACGHPIFGFGDVSMPIARAHVLMTLASELASTKIITTGGTIGTLTGDHVTAIAGHLGPGPSMIPVDVTFTSATGEKKFHFEVIENRQLTPTLVALAIYNGIAGNTAYGEGNTLDLKGSIELQGHSPVALDDLYSPIDLPVPSAFLLATSVESDFNAIYSNPYEPAKVTGVHIEVTSLADRRSAIIDGAWVEKREVHPGETVAVKVLLRPYRGDAFVKEIPITIPEQTARGNLEIVISDAATLNRNIESMTITSEGQLPGLEELVKLLNRQRRNDRLYATLLQQAPTLLVEDKEMPNAPLSAISVFDQRQSPGGSRLTWQSSVGEWSAAMDLVISGERTLSITVN